MSLRLFSFDCVAHSYDSCALAQKNFAKELLNDLSEFWGKDFDFVLDLGCGDGVLLRESKKCKMDFRTYLGCDLSGAMLECFSPLLDSVMLVKQDFNECLNRELKEVDLILSGSALQWAKNLAKTFELIAHHQSKVALLILTSGTFGSLHRHLGSNSPLRGAKIVRELLFNFFEGQAREIKEELYFSNPQELIAHLRGSGVMGGGVLGYQKAKRLFDYQGILEYEGVLFVGQSKQKGKQ